MNKPDLYLKYKALGTDGSENMIKKHFHLFKQNHKEPITMIDIGCGPGNLTHDLLLPLFDTPVRKVIGCDVTENMIDFANTTYGNDVLSYRVVDLGHEVPKDFVSYFDFVFSFWALQWIQDQRQLYANIHKIVKPDGQIFLTYIARSKLYDIYQTVWRKPEYSPYITNFTTAQSCFQKSKDPKSELKVILEQSGFEISLLELEKIQLDHAAQNDFKEFLTSLSPVYDKIPSELKEQFILDHVKEVDRNKDIAGPNNYYMNFDVFVVCAKRK